MQNDTYLLVKKLRTITNFLWRIRKFLVIAVQGGNLTMYIFFPFLTQCASIFVNLLLPDKKALELFLLLPMQKLSDLEFTFCPFLFRCRGSLNQENLVHFPGIHHALDSYGCFYSSVTYFFSLALHHLSTLFQRSLHFILKKCDICFQDLVFTIYVLIQGLFVIKMLHVWVIIL